MLFLKYIKYLAYVGCYITDVGRSCILVTIGGKNLMLDCGMHMGFNDDVSTFYMGIKHGFSCINICQVPWAEGCGF